MNTTIEASAVEEFLVRHLADVFSTMLSLSATPTADIVRDATAQQLSGSVGFVGEKVTGAVYLHMPLDFASHITGAMLGLPPEEAPGDADVNDVAGEVTNMLAGGLKSWLCDAGASCCLTPPAIIRGTAFQILPSEGLTCRRFGFECGAYRGVVEVHIKFT